MTENLAFSVDLFHGDTSFRPADWRIQFTPEINVNYLAVAGKRRSSISTSQGHHALRFARRLAGRLRRSEAEGPEQSVRLHFRARRHSVLHQRFSRVSFSPIRSRACGSSATSIQTAINTTWPISRCWKKTPTADLNTFAYRNQQVMIANVYRQDFLMPGYTIQASFHYDKDDPSFQFDTDNFLVRPAPIGLVVPHSIRAYYYGLAGDGHFGRVNITHAFYQVLGHDNFNEIAGRRVDINAQMAAAELSLDKDWLRYRVSFFYASGDKNPTRWNRARLRHDFRQSQFRRRLFQLLGSRGHPADAVPAWVW